jgi:hypothetical protein
MADEAPKISASDTGAQLISDVNAALRHVANDFVFASIVLQSPNQKYRYKISVNDVGELIVARLVFKDRQWSEPRPEAGRKRLAAASGPENLI